MKTILVVDDDPASLALVESALEPEGYQTKTVKTPEQALEIMKTSAVDVILLDIQLRGLDSGLEFAQRLKANVATRATPIIAFTAYADRRTADEALAAGCDGFLEKPITAAMLTEAIRKAFEKTG